VRLFNRFSLIRSLKGNLAIVLVITTVIPIILTGYISYRWIYIVQTEKIEKDIQSNITRETSELERRLDDTTSVSQLLAIEGGIGRDVVKFISNQDELEKRNLYADINASMLNVNFANPNLGVMFYYTPEYKDPIIFSNSNIEPSFQIDKLPLFYEKNLLKYYGPYKSLNTNDNSLVFSLVRTMPDGAGHTIYAYIETKLTGMEVMFNQDTKLSNSYHVIVNPNGKVAYSNLAKINQWGQAFAAPKGYKVFSAESVYDWKVYQLIPLSVYNREINKWIVQFILFSCLSLIVGIGLAWFIWKMVYGPIRLINKEITRFRNDQSTDSQAMTGLVEFDQLLLNFHQMRGRIVDLIMDVEEKEKRRGQLEVEKLLVQINPHFLHNTLNTIQWLARMQGQTNIAQLVSIFTRVLHYNLGKKSIIVTVEEEVEAIRDYIQLQNIRYDHVFKVLLDIDPAALEVSIPRFILQPLVENSLYHGFEQGEGEIQVIIQMVEEAKLLLIVKDNGIGIPEERLAQLFEQQDNMQKSGLGIGLHYVKKMLDIYYGASAQLEIASSSGNGTTISIHLPGTMKGSHEHV
jgi:two-component system, sensor histidine kinase YesM